MFLKLLRFPTRARKSVRSHPVYPGPALAAIRGVTGSKCFTDSRADLHDVSAGAHSAIGKAFGFICWKWEEQCGVWLQQMFHGGLL